MRVVIYYFCEFKDAGDPVEVAKSFYNKAGSG